ncbi:SHC-transforming protein 2 isoform X4 [Dromiciops gliroides]|uniref:SHC-transforming protein 2 isoform X4 n=1 Tax=Dromiciops gliroides TaxID=33562 RepID=UPI001CC415CD|nr:SHC-transforming protein 2 isoform X4 [Dromiciops gliroides]
MSSRAGPGPGPGAPSSPPPASPATPRPGSEAGTDEPDAPTTFCKLLPRMSPWKFAGPAAFLSRSPSSAGKELAPAPATKGGGLEEAAAPGAGAGPGLAAVLGACEPVCASPCSLQLVSRCRGAAGVRQAGAAAGARGVGSGARPPQAGDEWSRKGSFIHKPPQGWLHPDDRVLGPGVSYIVRAPNKALFSILGKSNLRFAGMSITINISIDGLNLMVPTTRQIIANHHMQSISFASGGDTDMTDYVAYVAKDPINQRACHILECCEGLAQSVISTVGQAFELRFKQYLYSPPKVAIPPERMMGNEESAWGEEEDATEHDYYNSIPGKEPPLGGLVDSRLWVPSYVHTQPPSSGAFSQLGSPARREQRGQAGLHWDLGLPGQPCDDGYLQADSRPLGSRDYEEHMYVNTQNLESWETEPAAPEESPKKDLFDMRPFEDALKLHECTVSSSGPVPIEDQWPSPPTRRAPIAPTEEQLRREPWYHGKMSRRAAEKLLRADGDFLVRDSVTNPGQYVLTGMHGGQPKHLLLVDPEGVVRTKDVLFESISHLIDYHLQNGQPILAAESELHLRDVVKRES